MEILKLHSVTPLTREQLQDFYASLHYYDRRITEDAAYAMFHRDETPLRNYWQDEAAFFAVYEFFRKIAKGCVESEFLSLMQQAIVPEKLEWNHQQKAFWLDNKEEYHRQLIQLYDFLESMQEFFDYEVTLISLGYPPLGGAA